MYGYEGYRVANTFTRVEGAFVWTIISAILAIVGGLVIYFLFLKNDKKFNNFLDKVRDFLNFKSLLLEEILKITYLISALFITLSSFGLISVSFVSFIVTLIFGNIALRIIYELSILLIKICKNTTEINSKLKK